MANSLTRFKPPDFRASARILGTILVLLPFAAASGQGGGPTAVETLPVVENQVAPTIELVGTVRPRRRAVIASEVAGLVSSLPVDEGNRVAADELICKLRDVPRRLAHSKGLARLKELESFLAVQEAELAKAKFEKERMEELWDQRRTSEKEHIDAAANHQAALARIEQARHAVEAQQATVDRLADELERTRIKAPFDGTIVAKHTELGVWVEQGGGIVELLDLAVVRARVNVHEAHVAYAEPGTQVHVKIDAIDRTFQGTISRVIPDADERARTFPIDVDIQNDSGLLKSGMFVRAAVPSGPRSKRLLVPKDAVISRGPMQAVFVVRGQRPPQSAEILPLRVDFEVLDYVAVQAEGLSAGDQVIVRGNERMMGPGPVIARPHTTQSGRPNKSSETADSEPVASKDGSEPFLPVR